MSETSETSVSDAPDDAQADAAADARADLHQDGQAGETAPASAPPRHRFLADGPERRMVALPAILDRYAAALSSGLQARLRTRVPVRRDPAIACTQPELIETLATDAILGACTLDPLPGEAWWVIDRALVAGITDRWFGGDGATLGGDRALSASERRMSDAVLDVARNALCDSLPSSSPIAARRIDGATADRLARHAPTGGRVVCRLRIGSGAGEGDCRLVLSPGTLARIDPAATVGSALDGSEPRGMAQDLAWVRGMRDCEIELNGVLAESTITLGDVMRLAPGDFIALDERQSVSFRADGRTVFDATVGTLDGRASASVTRLYPLATRR